MLEESSLLRKKKLTTQACMRIDRRMVTSKLLYFLFSAASASYEPYLLVFLISLGLDPIQAGLIGGIRVVGSLLGAPLWGFIADAKNSHKIVSLTICTGSLILLLAQPVAGMLVADKDCHRCIDDTVIKILVNASGNGSSTVTAVKAESVKSNASLFYVMLILNICLKFFDSAQSGVIDHVVVEKCYGNGETRADFGRQRLFGAFGFGTGVLISTFAIDIFQKTNVNCYIGMAMVHALLTILLLVIFIQVFKKQEKSIDNISIEKVNDNPKILELLIKTLSNVEVLFFLCTTFILGTMQSFYMSFNALLLRDLNAPNIANGLSISIAAVSCVITYFYGTIIINKLQGIWNTMTLCSFCYGIRFLLVGYSNNPWLVPLIQSLQAVCYGLFIVAGVLHVKKITPQPIRTTMYGIFNALKFGVSFIVGNVIGGYIYEEHKAQTLFIWAAYFAMAWTGILILFSIARHFLDFGDDPKEEQNIPADV